MKKMLLLCACVVTLTVAQAQNVLDYINLEDKVYAEGITSVSLLPNGYLLSDPIIPLGRGELILKFDDLESESRFLKYTVIHCTHDWQLSEMNPIEYIDGFTEDNLDNYNYSFNTIVHYMQYNLSFPNDNLRITKSGNYVLFVYDDTPDNPVLTRRFMVVENEQVGVTGSVHGASDVADRFAKQEVDFTVTTGNYPVRNPAMTLHATIRQNGRWDNAIYGLTYRSGFVGELSFDYDDGRNTFPGGSEFRAFDISTLRTNSDRIVGINFDHRQNQAYVQQDDARPYGAYETHNTMNGACIYRNTDMPNEFSEDYVNTHFTLKSEFPFTDGDVYVFGQLTDWQIKPEARLKYNEQYKFWETDFFIKQGSYNYQYVYVPNGTRTIDATYIEGSHFETHNDYLVLIYFKEEGSSYDKLIGVQHFNIQNGR